MKILVCGGRNYNDFDKMCQVLDPIVQSIGELSTIISGCARGADTLAIEYALMNSMNIEKYPADLKKWGRGEGHIRNQQMLDEGKPDLVVAFPGGKGTTNMIHRAKKTGVEVLVIE
jgi:predicted Rossmann-fold nucleotide-binding protein